MDPLPEIQIPTPFVSRGISRDPEPIALRSVPAAIASTEVERVAPRENVQSAGAGASARENRANERLRGLLLRLADEDAGEPQTLRPQPGFTNTAMSPEQQARTDDLTRRLFGKTTPPAHANPKETSSAASQMDPENRYDLQSYLQLIRSLSKDPEQLDDFLDQLEDFADGQKQGGDESLGGFLESYASAMSQGQTITTQASVNIQISVGGGQGGSNQENTIVGENGEILQADPLVLDLNGNGFELTTVDEGARFRIDGTDALRQTAFVTGGDAFLALDRNENGSIDSGLELFGDQHGAADGIEELRKFDDNGDNRIDAEDSVFDRLRLYQDKNMDGFSQPAELSSLGTEGIQAIFLHNIPVQQKTAGGNQLTSLTAYQRNDGSIGIAGDVNLNYRA